MIPSSSYIQIFAAIIMLILYIGSNFSMSRDLKPSRWMKGLLCVDFVYCVNSAINSYAETRPELEVLYVVTSCLLILYNLIQLFLVLYAFSIMEDNSKLAKGLKVFVEVLIALRCIWRISIALIPYIFQNADMELINKWFLVSDNTMEVSILLVLLLLGLRARKKLFGQEILIFGGCIAIPLYSFALNRLVGIDLMPHLATIITCYTYVIFHQTYIRNRYERKIKTEAKQLEERAERIKQESVLAISRAYYTMYSVNLDERTYTEIWARPSVHKFAGDRGNIEGVTNFIVSKLCSAEHKENLKAFFDLNTVQERLMNESAISIEYLAQDYKWFRSIMIVKDREEDGRVRNILFATQEIDKEKRHELETKEELQKAYIAAENASQAKTAFLSNMSHDIRTPMNGIIGMTNMAKKYRDDPEKLYNCLEKISINSEHLLTLINDVLELARVESGKTTLEKDIFDIREISRTCIAVISSYVSNREISIVEEYAPIDTPFVYTDSLRMRQVILNVMSNAVKYTPDGGTITLKFDSDVSDDGKTLLARMTCSDTGIGMSEEFLKTIFEPFAQENDHDARTQYKGTGLGMAIVKQLMDLFGGKVDVTSKQGMGTTIVLTFPLEIAVSPESQSGESESNVSVSSDELPKGLRLLLVEDNEVNLEIAMDMLENLGCEIETARDGLDAVEKFKSFEPGYIKCILMDVMMPRMNGYEATKAIRALDRPDAKSIAIIAMTANAFAEDIRMSHEAGMNDHISKPIEIKRVVDAINKHVKY